MLRLVYYMGGPGGTPHTPFSIDSHPFAPQVNIKEGGLWMHPITRSRSTFHSYNVALPKGSPWPDISEGTALGERIVLHFPLYFSPPSLLPPRIVQSQIHT